MGTGRGLTCSRPVHGTSGITTCQIAGKPPESLFMISRNQVVINSHASSQTNLLHLPA
jgi:hypothetical protein